MFGSLSRAWCLSWLFGAGISGASDRSSRLCYHAGRMKRLPACLRTPSILAAGCSETFPATEVLVVVRADSAGRSRVGAARSTAGTAVALTSKDETASALQRENDPEVPETHRVAHSGAPVGRSSPSSTPLGSTTAGTGARRVIQASCARTPPFDSQREPL